MKINKSIIAALNPCKDRLDNYVNNYKEEEFVLEDFLALDKITYTDKVWVVTRLFTHKQNVKWSIACAKCSLDNFEKLYPKDKRLRQALEAALNWTLNPTEENKNAARSAARSVESAAWSARSAAAARSVESAAWSASGAAWFAAAWAARSVESAATWSGDAWSADEQQEEINLLLMLEAL